jgi:plasmid maintenance system antidote protein VapI
MKEGIRETFPQECLREGFGPFSQSVQEFIDTRRWNFTRELQLIRSMFAHSSKEFFRTLSRHYDLEDTRHKRTRKEAQKHIEKCYPMPISLVNYAK